MRNEIVSKTNKWMIDTQPNGHDARVSQAQVLHAEKHLSEILFITSYPPRECGIATYSQDLIKALNHQFNQSFTISICPIESESEKHSYMEDVKYVLNTDYPSTFIRLSNKINDSPDIRMVVIQHEFGFFDKNEQHFKVFLSDITKPIIMVFHTILPNPDVRPLRIHYRDDSYFC
jgi:hypothetical protein